MWRKAFSPHLFARHEGEVYHQSGLDCCWKSSEATPSFYFNTFIEFFTLSLRPGLKRCTAPPPPPHLILAPLPPSQYPPPPVCLSAHYCTPKQPSTHTSQGQIDDCTMDTRAVLHHLPHTWRLSTKESYSGIWIIIAPLTMGVGTTWSKYYLTIRTHV